MRIAQIAPLWEPVPPRLYGGTERVVSHLCEALVAAGHDVTLFASAESTTPAKLASMRRQALRLDSTPLKGDIAAHLVMLDAVRKRSAAFDVLHFHIDLLHFPLFEEVAPRTLTTLHGRLDLTDLPEAYRRWSQFPLVAISESQRSQLPDANWIATVQHGMPAERLAFAPEGGDSLAFLGRLSPEKGADRAVEIARRAGRPIVLAGKIDRADDAYCRSVMAPLLFLPHVRWIGEVDDAQKSRVLGDAAALLFPIDWPEPFGLVLIEAMACGTPVIAWRQGSVPEIVEEGVTGFIVGSLDDAVEAVRHVHTLDRRRIRERFERRFSAQVMAGRYVRIYEQLVAGVDVEALADR
jgi:glycosyltransferase involved in cell wall biosynthesis